MTLVAQQGKQPTRKLQYAALGGAVASVLMGGLAVFYPEAHGRIPPGFEAGVATICAFVFGYIARERSG